MTVLGKLALKLFMSDICSPSGYTFLLGLGRFDLNRPNVSWFDTSHCNYNLMMQDF
jgi:hypothetical protein